MHQRFKNIASRETFAVTYNFQTRIISELPLFSSFLQFTDVRARARETEN